MTLLSFSRGQLVREASLTEADLAEYELRQKAAELGVDIGQGGGGRRRRQKYQPEEGDFLDGLGALAAAAAHPLAGGLFDDLPHEPGDDDRADDAVFRLVAELGGSISAEHGVGIAKLPWIGLTRSAEDLAAMRAIKKALDPRGMLNPGVIFPLE